MTSLMRTVFPWRFLRISQLYSLEKRTFRNWDHHVRIEFKKRKSKEKPNPELEKRSTFSDWNFKSELYAFGRRLHENLSEDTLRVAFTNQSYIDKEEKRRMELQLPKEDIAMNIENNDHLAALGEGLMSDYILRYLRYTFPSFPEEGVRAVHDYLMSEEILAHVATNIGTKDLILCEEIHPTKPTLIKTLKAVVGAVLKDNKEHKAELFVQDFVITQLLSKDVGELWQPFNPMGILRKILERENRAPPESRLLREAGRKTLLSVFVVGVYSDKQFLGMAPGETVDIAEELAARDCLKRMFNLKENRASFPFGKEGHELKLVSKVPNLGIDEWTSSKARMQACTRIELQ